MNNKEETVQDLSQELERLCLKQERLETQQRELSRAIKEKFVLIGRLSYKVNKGREPPPPLQQELVSGSGVYEGNRVKVTNRSKRQEEEGEAFGVTRDKLVKVQTRSGKIIRRMSKNLAKLN